MPHNDIKSIIILKKMKTNKRQKAGGDWFISYTNCGQSFVGPNFNLNYGSAWIHMVYVDARAWIHMVYVDAMAWIHIAYVIFDLCKITKAMYTVLFSS